MIIGDFDFVGMAILPPEAYPVLVVDPDAVLSGPITPEAFQPVSGWRSKFHEVADPV
jgi:hypothetical protein